MATAYSVEELELLFDIQAVAMRTGLPAVLIILKHLSEYPQQRVNKSRLIEGIKKDPDLEKVGYEINEMVIENGIRNLIYWHFLGEEGEEIFLRKRGKEAVRLLIISNR